ncbi:MAG: hypothetical protein RMI56_04630 [Sulfolobales archaeon]|nr:hypothetical protein [Sulfolobales archaeon]MDW8083069.1 hypothetical protein [Sulfolobales archaeon]
MASTLAPQSSEELVKHFLKLADLEVKYSEELKALSERLRHPVLKALFAAIAGDSVKHSQIYRAIVDLLTAVHPLLIDQDVKDIADTILKHIRTESMMIEETKKLLDQIADPRARILISAIHSDEVTHHGILVSIEGNIARREVFTEEEFWNQVWRDSPWHGAPGG